MVEKILRSAPDVGKIFVLINAKSHEAVVDGLKTEVAFLNGFFFFFVLSGGVFNKIYFSSCVNHRFGYFSGLQTKAREVLSRFHAKKTFSCCWEFV